MKKRFLLALLVAVLPLSMMVQDDVYFTTKKVEKTAKNSADKSNRTETTADESAINREKPTTV